MDEKLIKALEDIRAYEAQAELPAPERLPKNTGELPEAMIMEKAREYRAYLSFCRHVDAFLSGTRSGQNHALIVGSTPDLLCEGLGLSQFPISITGKHLLHVMRDYGITVAQVKRLPYELKRPLAVLDSISRHDSISLVLGMRDAQKNPVLANVKLGGVARWQGKYIPSNCLLSFYGKKDFASWIRNQKDLLLYWNKERSNSGEPEVSSLRAFGVASGIILRQSRAIVKPDPKKYLPEAEFILHKEDLAREIAFALRFIKRFTLREIAQIRAQAPTACFLATRAEYGDGLPDEKGKRLAKAPILIRPGESPILISGPKGGIYEYFDIRQTDAGNSLSSRLCMSGRPGIIPPLVKKGLSMDLSDGREAVDQLYPAARELFLKEMAAGASREDGAADLALRAEVYAAAIELQTYGSLSVGSEKALERAYQDLIKAGAADCHRLALDLTVTLEKAYGDMEDFQRNGLMMQQAEEVFFGREEAAEGRPASEEKESEEQAWESGLGR